MIVSAIPSPAPRPAPEKDTDCGVVFCANAGTAPTRNTMATRTANFSIFMELVTPKTGAAPVPPDQAVDFLTLIAHPGTPRSVLRVHRHPHEQRRQKREDESLQDSHEQFQRVQGKHSEHAADGHRRP